LLKEIKKQNLNVNKLSLSHKFLFSNQKRKAKKIALFSFIFNILLCIKELKKENKRK